MSHTRGSKVGSLAHQNRIKRASKKQRRLPISSAHTASAKKAEAPNSAKRKPSAQRRYPPMRCHVQLLPSFWGSVGGLFCSR